MPLHFIKWQGQGAFDKCNLDDFSSALLSVAHLCPSGHVASFRESVVHHFFNAFTPLTIKILGNIYEHIFRTSSFLPASC